MSRIHPRTIKHFTLWIFMTAMGCMTTFPLAFGAQAEIKLKVVTTAGREMILASPISGDWEFALGDFTVQFQVAAIKHIERQADGTFDLVSSTGDTFTTLRKQAGTIQGDGEWGRTNLNWQEVKSVEITGPTAAEAETQEDNKPRAPQWQLTSVGGTALDVGELQSSYYDWRFETQAFTFQVATDQLQSMERLPQENAWRITFLDGKTFDAISSYPDTGISGGIKWGRASIIFSKVAKISRLAPPPSKGETRRDSNTVAALTFRSGLTLDVRGLGGSWPFTFHEFEIDVDPERVASVEAGDVSQMFRINDLALQLKAEQRPSSYRAPSGESGPFLDAETKYGSLVVPWQQVQRITRIGKPAAREGEATGYPLTLETNSGATLAARDVNPDSATFAGMTVTAIRWANVQSVSTGANAFTIQGDNDFTMTLTGGALKGKMELGMFAVPLSAVRQIRPAESAGRVAPRKGRYAPSDDEKEAQLVARVTFQNGLSVPEPWILITGSEVFKIHNETSSNLLEIKRDRLRFWLEPNQFIQQGFRNEGNGCSMNLFGVDQKFDLPERQVSVITSMVTLHGELARLSEIVPLKTAGKSSPGSGQVLQVTVERRDSIQETFKARRVWFANYPETGWTGSYFRSEWPFQWWPDESIEVVRDQENEHTNVKLSKLQSIEVLDNYASRRLRFRSREGNELIGVHFHEVLNQENKHGPYKWKLEDEGVLLKLGDGVYVFLPFVAINRVSFPVTGP